MSTPVLTRRSLIKSTAALAAATALPMPAWARGASMHQAAKGFGELSGSDIELAIGEHSFMTGGRMGHAFAVNGTVPGPLIRLREGQDVRLNVTHNLSEDSSIHWHGLLLPFQFDGVPGVSFPGIRPGERFTCEFPLRQNGTYWWHAHSGLQEQAGHYGPIIVESADPDPRYDRDYVVLLSEFTPIHPHGHFFELVNGADHMHQPLKHTVIVQPGGKATFDLTANEPGDWAFHCHLLYHMHAGMMQVVTVRPFPEEGEA